MSPVIVYLHHIQIKVLFHLREILAVKIGQLVKQAVNAFLLFLIDQRNSRIFYIHQ